MKTLVIGASVKPERYSNKAIVMLRDYKYEVIAYGNRAGEVLDVKIEKEWNPDWDIDTVTLYVGPANQTDELRQRIVALKPRRVIFNPGTENSILAKELEAANIESELACTLVLLTTGEY